MDTSDILLLTIVGLGAFVIFSSAEKPTPPPPSAQPSSFNSDGNVGLNIGGLIKVNAPASLVQKGLKAAGVF